MEATVQELTRICDAIKDRATAGEDIEGLGFELIKTARALRDQPFNHGEKTMKTLTKRECPVCMQHTLSPWTNEIENKCYWFCEACGAAFTDISDEPAQKISEPCPACGKEAHKLSSKATGTFWKCKSCKTDFADENNKPATPCVCEKCGANAVTRHAAANCSGGYFWGCGKCRVAYEDINGKIGRCFDDIDE